MTFLSGLLLTNILLIPHDGFLGEIPSVQICSFRYQAGTVLTPGTRLTVTPSYTETYGLGSVVLPEDGMLCTACKVPKIEMDATGITTIHCVTDGYK